MACNATSSIRVTSAHSSKYNKQTCSSVSFKNSYSYFIASFNDEKKLLKKD